MKSKILLLCCLLLSRSLFAQVPPGQIAFYPFNGNANDESGNGRNGVVTGVTLTTDRFGQSEKAYLFNGTNNFIRVSNWNQITGNTPRTISVWFKMPLTNNWKGLLSWGAEANNQENWVGYFNNTRTGIHYFGFHGYNNNCLLEQKLEYFDERWHQLTITYDGTIMKFWIDGVRKTPQDGLNGSPSNLNTASSQLFIGCRLGTNSFFQGYLDDIRIYNRGLSDSEVLQLYQTEVAPVSAEYAKIGPNRFIHTIGQYNTSVGNMAGNAITTGGGTRNTFLGFQSGRENSTGSYNTFMGHQAGMATTTGSNNVFLGANANPVGINKAILQNSVAIGANAKVAVSEAIVLGDTVNTNLKVGIGTAAPSAKLHIVSGTANQSGLRLGNLTANSPTVAGSGKVLSVNPVGDVILVTGGGGGSTSTHSDSVWVRTASSTYYSGTGNVGIGMNAPAWKLDVNGDINLTSSRDIRMGGYTFIQGSPYSSTANVLIGHITGSGGIQNVFVGTMAGSVMNNGGGNVFVGWNSGNRNSTGASNTFIGLSAGSINTSGSSNVFLGSGTGGSNSTGRQNTFVGVGAGSNNISGINNTYLGINAGSLSSNLNNAVALGANAKVAISDAIVLGDTTNTNIKVGIGTAAPQYPLDVKGNINIRKIGNTPARLLFASRSSITTDEQDYLVITGGQQGESGLRLANMNGASSVFGIANQFLSIDNQGRVGLYNPLLSAAQIRLQTATTKDWADHVFVKGYSQMPLDQLEQYIQENQHLPHLPSAQTIMQHGATVESLFKGVVQTQEEQTKYILELQKANQRLQKENEEIRAMLKQLLEKR